MRTRHDDGRRERHEADRDRGEFGFRPRGRGRTRRGDIRIALLAALADGPAHGYEIIQRLEQRTGGRWKPSPGSVYPTLQLLDDGGLVTSEQREGKRVYSITDAGSTELAERLAERADAPGGTPWQHGDDGAHGDLRRSVGQLMMAARQVGAAGDPAQVAAAIAAVDEARRTLYRLLAEQ
jgi:DNA-binding PadR family transcriptional regulator